MHGLETIVAMNQPGFRPTETEVLISKPRPEFDQMEAQAAIEEVMNKFDFAPVLKYMHSVNWKYCYTPDGVTMGVLRDTAREVLTSAVYDERSHAPANHRSVSTGGFEARMDRWGEFGQFRLSLDFIPFRAYAYFD